MTRGQGAFEYLLILGGSVLLAAVMLVFVQGNLGTVSPEVNMSVGTINKLTAAVGADVTCNDCDAVFVNVGEANSITNGMLQDSSIETSKIIDNSIKLVDVDTAEIQRRVSDICPSGTNIVRINEDGTLVCDAGSWVIQGNNITNRNTDMVIIPTLNVTKNLYAPGIGAGSINITNGTIDNLTVRNIRVLETAYIGTNTSTRQLNIRGSTNSIVAPGFVVSGSMTNATAIYTERLCMKRSLNSTGFVCIDYWTQLLDVLFAQVG